MSPPTADVDVSVDQAAGIIYEAVNGFHRIVERSATIAYWEDAPETVQAKTIQSVQFARDNPDVTPREFHDQWVNAMTQLGQDSPLAVPFAELPSKQRRMAAFVLEAARLLTGELDAEGHLQRD